MSFATILFYLLLGCAGVALFFIIWSYARGLKGSPREFWIITGYNFVEYSAYGAMNIIMIIWLSADCGLSDVGAGSYLTGWGTMLSLIVMVVGPLVDSVGIRRICFLSVVFLFISRFFMAWITHPAAIFVLGFIPLALGFAIVSPVVSVGIKRYTTREGAALGFGLFYVVMNIGFAVGGWAFDWIRGTFARRDAAGVIADANAGVVWLGHHFSTNQLFFVFGTLATVLSVVVLIPLRDGVERTDEGIVVTPPPPRGTISETIAKSFKDTVDLMNNVFREKYFWIFLGLIGLTIFVRFVFFHFQYTFPKYGLRVLGEDAKIGNIYGVLNPVLIVFLVPLVAMFTKKVCSYRMLLVGAAISAVSCFIAVIPGAWFAPLTHSVLGEMVFVNWLGMAPDMTQLMASPPTPDYWPMIFFIVCFTLGEAIWSPRLMQFSTEIAPKGRESTYLSLSILPWFVAKLVVGPLSGVLLNVYTPVDKVTNAVLPHPQHAMIWFWVGATALITPIGLMLCGRWIPKSADHEKTAEH